ncbi:hypothetical protein ENSA7_03810 [Enhygromyxa salina]|uniref:Uncharacterized protein n=2 Tax=Enhygromyxa salina TaxID=215803 RepID=A0A2S9YXU0_9BACT|nr:hypothetical protein ENSA7_03810 [Enhygromyxa salina]
MVPHLARNSHLRKPPRVDGLPSGPTVSGLIAGFMLDRLGKIEEVLKAPDGHKSKRRPDITTVAPDRKAHRENVGRVTRRGRPVPREERALDDLEQTLGVRLTFTPYN